jgi:glycosyltransferase involved in cell wall biosynthesis
MNIVFLCNEYPPAPHGGIGTFVQTTARALAKRGHRVHVLGLREADDAIHQDGDVTVHTLREKFFLGGFQVFVNRLRVLRALKRLVRDTKADIVEVPDYLGMLPFPFRECAVVVRLHLSQTAIAMHAGAAIDPVRSWCERRTLTLHRNWIGVSHRALALTEQFFGLSPALRTVIYSGLELSASEVPPPLPTRFVFFGGTVSERKGALVLAAAARLFLAKYLDVHLVYAGAAIDADHPVAPRIHAILDETMRHRVHFLGALSRGAFLECMRRCEVFAFPSRLETFGLVVAEAMLCGRPVVVSNEPPFTEFVEDARTGLLVNPADPVDIASAIDRLLDDHALAQRIAAAGQAHAQAHFSVDRSTEQTLAFYDKVLHAPR